jgi:hypothetical protein
MSSSPSPTHSDRPEPLLATAAAFEGMQDTQPIDINWWSQGPAAPDAEPEE